jgi:hypothetical protein
MNRVKNAFGRNHSKSPTFTLQIEFNTVYNDHLSKLIYVQIGIARRNIDGVTKMELMATFPVFLPSMDASGMSHKLPFVTRCQTIPLRIRQ